MPFSFAVSKSDRELYFLLNKTVLMTKSEDMDSALASYMYSDLKASFTQFLKDNWMAVMITLTALFSVIVVLLLQRLKAVRKANEQKRLLEEAAEVAELKQTIASLLDNMPGMNYTKNAETGEYLACNQAFAEYAHKNTPEDVIGSFDAELFDAAAAKRYAEDDKMALSMSKPYVFFEDVRDAAGGRRQFQTTKLKYKDASGRLCVLGMCQDVTDMVRIQRENAMTKEAYETAVSSGLIFTHIAQTLARDYTDLFYVNTDTEEFIEYRMGEGKDALAETRRGWHFFSDCTAELAGQVYEDDREAFRQAMKRKTLMKALSMKNTFIMTYRQTSAGGSVYVSMKVFCMENDDHFIIIGITNVNAQMREAMAKSEALASALAAAEQANKAKMFFLSRVSHEIRTPMNAIIGMDSLALKKDSLALKKDSLDADTREYLEKIGGSARHLLALINDILEMSRIESGRVVLRREPFSFSAMLDQINAMFLAQCVKKGLSYECHIQSQVDETYIGDDIKLKEVLANILSNAVKFTDAPGSVTLTVERTAVFEDQSTLCFRVKDTGIGMEKAFLPLSFEPFSQEDGLYKTKYGSAGLGLAIAKRIVEMMNGTISVESEKGVGSEFSVTITLSNCDQKSAAQGGAIDLQELDILVVDDDPIEAEHARTVLEEAGIRADTCTSGQEALRMMEVRHTKHKPYNLVLMDWNMPGMSGLEASAEIRKQYEGESSIVVLTAYNWDDIQEEAHCVGVNSFLAKPLLAENVIAQFNQIARRNHMALFKGKNRADLAGRRILLAEDMEINAEIMMDTLRLEGIEAEHAENGRLALEMFRNREPGYYSAILMDVRMPEMDGLEAAWAIRAWDREDARRIPIIALTANAFDEDVERSLQAGMNAHLMKPVESDSLYQTLGELIYAAENTEK